MLSVSRLQMVSHNAGIPSLPPTRCRDAGELAGTVADNFFYVI